MHGAQHKKENPAGLACGACRLEAGKGNGLARFALAACGVGAAILIAR